nr:DUF3324 domain-containing protein [Listeria ivanovii]
MGIKRKKDTQIENKYSYVIGLQLSETEKVIKPEMELLDVFPGQSNYRNVVYSKLQNKTAIIIRDLKVDGKVYKKNSDKVLHETKKKIWQWHLILILITRLIGEIKNLSQNLSFRNDSRFWGKPLGMEKRICYYRRNSG